MKKVAALVFSCVLLAGVAFAAESTEADHKWLSVVQSMIAKGETHVSTPSEVRSSLLKEWASKNGYSVTVAKSDVGFSVDLSKSLAKQ